ncbi:MAG: T9SS type A sorting domain-containing protein, partial [Bacteroidetes bacterium]|nr:T9SS type A sorting domain-containing protein [Bacteroidota bacterium]
PKQSKVELIVYNILGDEVAVLINGEKVPGSYDVKFDGSKLASGVYFCRLKVGEYSQTKKIVLLK